MSWSFVSWITLLMSSLIKTSSVKLRSSPILCNWKINLERKYSAYFCIKSALVWKVQTKKYWQVKFYFRVVYNKSILLNHKHFLWLYNIRNFIKPYKNKKDFTYSLLAKKKSQWKLLHKNMTFFLFISLCVWIPCLSYLANKIKLSKCHSTFTIEVTLTREYQSCYALIFLYITVVKSCEIFINPVCMKTT